MHAQLDAPVLAVCPDEAAAELFQKDLSALLGQDVPLLTARDYTFYTVESVSRQTEQKRLSALYALAAGEHHVEHIVLFLGSVGLVFKRLADGFHHDIHHHSINAVQLLHIKIALKRKERRSLGNMVFLADLF